MNLQVLLMLYVVPLKFKALWLSANADTPADRRIEFRIGINVGDIILDDGDIYDDGVNVAARSVEDPGI